MIRILVGDAQERLLELPEGSVQSVITDPIWPNAPRGMFPDTGDPKHLLEDTLRALPRGVKRLVVILRADSDPRFLAAVPRKWPFFHASTLPYALPGFVGRKLMGHEIAYCFGVPVSTSRLVSASGPKAQPFKVRGHPCPRSIEHMVWLVDRWSEPGETILDPFAGSGTTGMAAQRLQRNAILVEISPDYAELAKRRIEDDAPLLAEVTIE